MISICNSVRNSVLLGLTLLAAASAWAQAPATGSTTAWIQQISPHPATVAGQAATQLPDGRWLLTGGASASQSASTSALIVDTSGNTTVLPAHLIGARAGHSATLLPNGKVFLFGGTDAGGNVLATAEIFDPIAQTFTSLANPGLLARTGHSATVVTSGQVLIAGGAGAAGQALSSVELYSIQCQPCLPQRFANLNSAHKDQTAAILSNGNVLLWGGANSGQTPSLGELADPNAVAINPVSAAEAQQYVQALDNTAAPTLVMSQPAANAQNVPLDQALVVAFSERMTMGSLSNATVTLMGPNGLVAINPVPVEYGVLLFVSPKQSLLPGSSYTLFIDGALNQAGQPLPFTTIGFSTAQLNGQTGTTLVTPDNVAATAATGTQSANAAASEASSEGTLALDNEVWVPDASNYHGLWTSKRAVLAKLHPPHYEELQRSYLRTEMMFDGRISPEQREAKLPVVRRAAVGAGVTALVGQALRLNGQPLAGVTVRMGKQSATTDANGEFLLSNIPSGAPPNPSPMLEIDGRSASSSAHQYGRYFYLTHIKAGQVNALRQPVWMTALDTAHAVSLSSPTAKETVVTNPLLPGLEVHIPAGAVIRDADGKIVTQVSLTPVPNDQLPFPMPYGQVPVYYTLQPGGAVIQSTTGKPLGAKIVYPNYSTQPAGARFELFDYDPAGRGWYVYGQATVSPDGKRLISNKDFVIYQFTASSATSSGGPQPNGPQNCKSGGSAGDPVSCFEGMFYESHTDLAISDIMPLTLQRSYHSRDANQHAFGIGAADNFDAYLYFPDISGYNAESIDLVQGDGSATVFGVVGSNVHYIQGAVYQSTTPGPFYMATITVNYDGGNFILTKADGTVYTFTYYSPQLMSIKDRLGNTVAITRDTNNRVVLVTSPNGNTISFQYESSSCPSCISSAVDNTGRQTSYSYDGSGNLNQFTDVAGGITTFTYAIPSSIYPDSDPVLMEIEGNDYFSGLLTVNDPRNNAGQVSQPKVTNIYYGTADIGPGTPYVFSDCTVDVVSCPGATYYKYTPQQLSLFGRVKQQTYADGSINQFAYSFDTNGNNTQTTITDGLGNITVKSFSITGLLTQMVTAQGQPEQQTITYNWSNANLLQSTTDTLGRQTAYTYDSNGNVKTITRLAGTSNAVTTSFTYTTDGFNHIASITDALSHTTTLSYDSKGNLAQVQDANGNAMQFTVTASGQLASVKDALGNTVNLKYDGANLVTVTDALNHTYNIASDAAGRPLQWTNPIGNTDSVSYDAYNHITQFINGLNKQTAISYDPDSNLTQVKDANGHTHGYAYDNTNNLSSYTDPLGQSEAYQYDVNHNLTQKTDRKGQATKIAYDHLGRPISITFADNSSIKASYDAGNRLTKIVDSQNGTINYGYDNLDRLISINSATGSIVYTYYANGLRQTMTASGQPTISYTYDAGNRLTRIIQAAGAVNNNTAQTVNYSYDSINRRTQTILPNGIAMNYGYDNANRLTSITYTQGSNTIGNITYGYDAAGHRTAIGGSFARATATPASSSTFDAANRLTNFNGTTMTYDANGNLTNDGTNTYTWNARNQLISISGGTTATFSYDAMGRRTSKTITGVTSNYLYDGLNIIGETTTGTTFLTGLGVDETLAMESSSSGEAQVASYLTDALGSTIRLADGNGNKLVDYTYSTYGITTADAQSNNPFQYTGRENDGDSLYYYRARYYSPTLQRFISWDPIGLRGGIDPYVYANGNPLQFRDPYGLWAWGDPLPQGVVDAAAGFGDGASFGATNWIRNQTGTNGVVNQCSAIYQGGVYVGFAFGAIATSGVGAEEEAIAEEASGLGDLTKAEVDAIQDVVNQAGRPLEVVGSAAKGTRTAASDIDYVVPPSSLPYYEGLESQLPGIDPSHGIVPGVANPNIGPSIPFYPTTFP